jgi:hypothetical protein
MKDKIYNLIEVLVIKDTNDKLLPSTYKIQFFNASITLSGDYIIFNSHDKHDTMKFESAPYHLEKIKGYKTS